MCILQGSIPARCGAGRAAGAAKGPFAAARRLRQRGRAGAGQSAAAVQHAGSGGQCGAPACLLLPQSPPHPSSHAPRNCSAPALSLFRYAAEGAWFLHFQSCKHQGQACVSGEVQGLGKCGGEGRLPPGLTNGQPLHVRGASAGESAGSLGAHGCASGLLTLWLCPLGTRLANTGSSSIKRLQSNPCVCPRLLPLQPPVDVAGRECRPPAVLAAGWIPLDFAYSTGNSGSLCLCVTYFWSLRLPFNCMTSFVLFLPKSHSFLMTYIKRKKKGFDPWLMQLTFHGS